MHHKTPLVFFKYIFLIMLLELSQFSPLVPFHLASPHSLRQSPYHCPYSWVWLLYFECCTLHPHNYSVTTNLYFLILSPFSPIPLTPLPPGNCPNVPCICESVSVLLVYFVFWIPHVSEIARHLSWICFIQHSTLQVHPCCCRRRDFIPCYS